MSNVMEASFGHRTGYKNNEAAPFGAASSFYVMRLATAYRLQWVLIRCGDVGVRVDLDRQRNLVGELLAGRLNNAVSMIR